MTERIMEHVERQEIEEYRSVSILAIVALLCGIVSLAALAHPVMLFMPFVTAILSALALRQIARSDGGLTGRGIALIGIGLALTASSAALTRSFVATEIQRRHAKVAADQWLDMLHAGNPLLAHQWTLAAVLRQRPQASLEEAYEDSERKEGFDGFFEKEPAKTLVDVAPQAEFEFLGSRGVTGNRVRRFFMFEYAIRAPDHPSDGQHFLVVVLRRFDSEYRMDWWQISSVQSPESPS